MILRICAGGFSRESLIHASDDERIAAGAAPPRIQQ